MEGRSLPAEPADLADAEQHGRTMVNIRHPLIAVAPRSRGRLSHEHSGPSLQRALCSSARVASTRGRGIGVSVQSSSQCYKGSCTGSTDQTVNS
ncbi:hypothetical protein PF003_g20746 [Phytophthora fragariae]|nr:hypothetical protein PF003_g20746 [Phytophthora fragariae]